MFMELEITLSVSEKLVHNPHFLMFDFDYFPLSACLTLFLLETSPLLC